MKIIQVQTQAEAAGAQRISDMLGGGMREAGHDVTTVFMYRKTPVYDGDPHARFILRNPPRGLLDQAKACWGLLVHLIREKPDAVLCFQYYGVAFGVAGARMAGARCIIANQSGAPRRGGMLGLMSMLDRVYGHLGVYSYSVVNSSWTAAQFEGYPDRYKDRLHRIDHGVVAPPHVIGRQKARRMFGLPENACIAMSSGRLTSDKNQIVLLEVLEASPKLHVALAGMGPQQDQIKKLAQRKGIEGRLHLVGELDPQQIYDFLAAGDLYIFPSRAETFGLAVVEAAISGLPIIANDLAVLQEVLRDQNGQPAALFVDTEDPKQIAAAIDVLLADGTKADALRQSGRSLAKRYSPQAMVEAYARLIAASF